MADDDKMFVVQEWRCEEGHEYELNPYDETETADDAEYATCGECGGSFSLVEVDLIEELVKSAGDLGETAAFLIERKPELKERVEAMVEEALATMDKVITAAAA